MMLWKIFYMQYIMKTITRKKNHKTRKHIKGGNNERIQKLKNTMELMLQFVFYQHFAIKSYKILTEPLPESDMEEIDVLGIRGVKKNRIVRNFTFQDYIKNDVPLIPRLNLDELISNINLISESRGYAYQLLPTNLFSDKNLKEIDNTIEKNYDSNYVIKSLYLDKFIDWNHNYDTIDDLLDTIDEIYNVPDR